MPKSLFVFNPLELPKETLIDNFVIRKAMMQRIFDLIEREAFSNTSSQHLIILGERGMGKTTLLARLKYKIEQTQTLNKRLIPIIFSEEQPSVKNLATFWELFLLAIENNLDLQIGSLKLQVKGYYYETQKKNQYNEKTFAEYIYSLIFDLVRKYNKKIILFADNFHLILEVLSEQEQQRLREILMTSPYIQIIGASPTVVSESTHYEKPFFEFFRTERLDILNEEESLTLLRHYSEDNHIVKKVLEEDPKRIELIRRTTGGNMRSLLMFYELLDENKFFDAYDNFNKILNNLTPFYTQRINDLGIEKKAILNAIALAWQGIKIKEIAELVREKSNMVSAYIKQLETAGLVESYIITKEGGIRPQALYQLTDRMFNIWYLMRYGGDAQKQRVLWFLETIEAWLGIEYSRKAFEDIWNNIDGEKIKRDGYKFLVELKKGSAKNIEVVFDGSNVESTVINKITISESEFSPTDYLTTFQNHREILNLNISDQIRISIFEAILPLSDKEKLYKIIQNDPNNPNILPALQKRHETILDFSKKKYSDYWIESEKASENICLSFYLSNDKNFELSTHYLKKAYSEAHKLNGILRNKTLLKYVGEAYVNLANKDENNAEEYFSTALSLNYYDAFFERGRYYELKKEYQKAFDDYLQAYEHDINLSKTTFRIGLILDNFQKNHEEAISFYEESKQRGIEKFINYHLAWAYYRNKNISKAIEEMKIAFDNGINDSEKSLGHFFSMKYDVSKDELDFEEMEKWYMIGVEKDEIDSINGLAWTYYQHCIQGKKEYALTIMQKMYDTRKMNKAFQWHTYGMILLWNNKVEESKLVTSEHFLYDTVLMESDFSDFMEYLLMLCARGEYEFLLEYFTGSRGAEIHTKERFSAIYFVLMKLMKNDEEYERMRPELKETVDEMLENVVSRKGKYCS